MDNFVDNEFNNYAENTSYFEAREWGSFVNNPENQPLIPEISVDTHKTNKSDDDKAKKSIKNSNKIVTIAMQASGAVCTAAVVVAMVVSMPFSVNVDVNDITAASAIVEINTELIGEQGDYEVPIYEVNELDSAEIVATGNAPTGKTVFPIGGLKSDTQYRVAVKQGEEILKEYVFRTLITEKMGRDRPINDPQVEHFFDEESGRLDMSMSWQAAEADTGKVVTTFSVSCGKNYADNLFVATTEDENNQFSTVLPIGEYRLRTETRYVLDKGGYAVISDEVTTIARLPNEEDYYFELLTDNFGDGFGVGVISYFADGLLENAKGHIVAHAAVAQNGVVLEAKQKVLTKHDETVESIVFDSLVFGQSYDFDVQLLFVADSGVEFVLGSESFVETQAYGNMGLEGLIVTPVYKVTTFESANVIALALKFDWKNVKREVRDFYLIGNSSYQFLLDTRDATTNEVVEDLFRDGVSTQLADGILYMNYYPDFEVANLEPNVRINGILMSKEMRLTYFFDFFLPNGQWDRGSSVIMDPTPVAGFGAGDSRVAGQSSIGECLPNYFENAANGLEIVESEYVIINSDTTTEVATFATAAEALAFQPPTGSYELRITKTYRDNETGLDAVASHTIGDIAIVS